MAQYVLTTYNASGIFVSIKEESVITVHALYAISVSLLTEHDL